MIFSEKLQLLRKSKGQTQENLAEKLDVSRQAVAKWESGQAYPDIGNLVLWEIPICHERYGAGPGAAVQW